jgi:hypothetical protein
MTHQTRTIKEIGLLLDLIQDEITVRNLIYREKHPQRKQAYKILLYLIKQERRHYK